MQSELIASMQWMPLHLWNKRDDFDCIHAMEQMRKLGIKAYTLSLRSPFSQALTDSPED